MILLTCLISLSACTSIFQGPPTPTPLPRITIDEVDPAIELTPSEGYAGTYVNLRGTGWLPSTMIIVKLADEQGEFNTGFLYPIAERWLFPGDRTVVAYTEGGELEMTQSFSVVSPTDVSLPTATASPVVTSTPTGSSTRTESATELAPTSTVEPTATIVVVIPNATPTSPDTPTLTPTPTDMPTPTPTVPTQPTPTVPPLPLPELSAELVLSPSSGPANTLVTASGGGFPANTQVNLFVARVDEPIEMQNTVILGAGVTDGRGRYEILFGVPLVWPDGAFIEAGPILVVVTTTDAQQQRRAVFEYAVP